MAQNPKTPLGINFLPQDVYLTESELEKRRRVITGSVIVLTVYLILVAGVIAVHLLLSAQQNRLTQSIAALASQIGEYREQEILYYTLLDRVKKITPLVSLVSAGTDLPQAVIKIKQTLPPTIQISQITAKNQSLAFEVNLSSPQALNEASEAINTLADQLGFTQVKVSSLGRSSTTNYSAVLEFITTAKTQI